MSNSYHERIEKERGYAYIGGDDVGMDAGMVLELDAAEESLNTSEGEASLKRREREREATKSSEDQRRGKKT
jgi:hypothetical protein